MKEVVDTTKQNQVDAEQASTGWLERTSTSVHDVKLSQILLEARIMTPREIENALDLTYTSKQALATVLSAVYAVTDHTLRIANDALNAIERSGVDRRIVANALYVANSTGMSLQDVLTANNRNSLMECLLLDSGIASESQLTEGRRLSYERNIPLSTALLMLRTISFTHLDYAFECWHLVDEGMLSMAVATKVLNTCKNTNIGLKASLERHGMSPDIASRIKLGDLLIAGRVVTDVTMLSKIEESINCKRLIGSILMEAGLISEQMLKDALTLQNLCAREVIDRKTAVKMLRRSVENDCSLEVTARESGLFLDQFATCDVAVNLVLKAGLATGFQMADAEERFGRYGMGAMTALVAAGVLTASARTAAIECSRLVNRQVLKDEEAVLVLHHCDRNSVTYEVALEAMGLSNIQEYQQKLEESVVMGFQSNRAQFSKSFELAEVILVVVVSLAAALTIHFCDPCHLRFIGVPLVIALTTARLIAVVCRYRTKAALRARRNSERADDTKAQVGRMSPTKLRKFA